MVRGKKRNNSSPKSNTESNTNLTNCLTPQQKKPKRRFKGKLSHSGTVSPNKITKYYTSVTSPKSLENSPVLPSILNNVNDIRNEPSVLVEKRSILLETNVIKEKSHSIPRMTCDDEINKTESCVPFSPSTALSKLDLNVNKKISKVKKRLPIDNEPAHNILKTLNEHSVNGFLKNDLRNNSKISNDYPSGKNQTKLTEYYPVRRSVRKTGKIVLEEKQKTLEKAILSNKEDGLAVRMFEGKGRGVIAARKFYKGEFVVEYAGELITMEEAKKREAIYSQDENTGCYMYYFKHKNSQYCVDATKESNRFGRLLNHSRNGNLSTKTVEVKGIPRLILIAKEDINPGYELTYDYGDRSKLSLQFHPWLAQ